MNTSEPALTAAFNWTNRTTSVTVGDCVLATFEGLLTVSNLLINSLALAGLIYGKTYQTSHGVCMISLTCADLGVVMFFLPYSLIAGTFGEWRLGQAICAYAYHSGRLFYILALIAQTLLCLDRFIATQWPYWFNAHMTVSKAVIANLVGWAIGVVLEAIHAGNSSEWIYVEYRWSCVAAMQNSFTKNLVSAIRVACYLTIIVTTIQVSRVVRRHRRQIAVQDAVAGVQGQDPVMEASIIKSFEAVILMSVLLTVSNLAFLAFFLLPKNMRKHYIYVPCRLIFHSCSVLDILIYTYKKESFRGHLRDMYKRLCRQSAVQNDIELNDVQNA